MDRSEHTRRMRETSDVVIPIITTAYQRLADVEPNLAKPMARFVERRTRLHQPLMRPYLVRMAYEICGGIDWTQIAHACAAAEIYNISTYQANLALDRKLGIDSPEERAEQFSCSMISMELAHAEIIAVGSTQNLERRIVNGLQSVNREIYCGQFADMHALSVGGMIEITDYKEVYALYECRCRQLGGYFSHWCLTMGAILANNTEEDVVRIGEIGMLVGIAGQMVNDVGDLVPVPDLVLRDQSLRYQVGYSDLLNGKATLAIIHAFEQKDQESCELALAIWRQQISDPAIQILLTRRLLKIGAFAVVRREVERYEEHARSMIRQFSASDARNYLVISTTALSHNKYFTALRNMTL